MGWYGPSGNCSCGCFDCIADDGFYKKFKNTPVIKITISGLPSSYQYMHFEFFPFMINQRYEYDLVGMDSANGTYFWPLRKSGSGCLVAGSDYFDSYFTTDSRITRTYTLPGCSQLGSTSSIQTPFITIDGFTLSGPRYSIAVKMARGSAYSILGQIELTPATPYTASEEDNTVFVTNPLVTQTWPRASGEIKILRKAQPAVVCGLAVEDASGFVFETIGNLTAELIDL